MKREQLTARELVKQYGTIGAVLFFRSSKHGTLFDHDLFQKLDNKLDHNVPRESLFKNKVLYFVPRLCHVVNACFTVLNSDS